MNDFNKLCKIAEQLDPAEYRAVIEEKAVRIIPALYAVTEDIDAVEDMLTSFMLACVYADGKLDEAEYEMMLPLLKVLFGENHDFKTVKEKFESYAEEGKALKEIADFIVDILGLLSEDLKEDIITVCLLICAVDGKISYQEKKFIKQLMK